MATNNRKPDFKVSVVSETNYHEVGAAWVNESGTISITLNPFVAIPITEKTKLMLIRKDYKPNV